MADGPRLILCLLSTCLSTAVAVESRCGVTVTVSKGITTAFKRVNITDAVQKGAVCNDYSQGIYYLREATNKRKWIIYLEGGVGCGNMEECNKRYKERPELMMSRGYPETIEGRDIFDPSPEVNPDYWDYNMVLIPYCTSDLWVGNSSWIPTNTSRFNFSSSATHNQFAFRGSVVFRSVVLELLYKGMNLAKDVVLVGSSAGGIGAMNQAGWLKSRLSGNMTLSVILDSAWFINFHGNLQGKFDFDYVSMSMNILSHIPCQDFSIGYPCCISAPCMLRKSPQTTLDFPNIPVFVIFSQYDLFILSRALENLENETDDVRTLEWFRTIAMYGEVMKVRLNDTRVTSKNMSYFVPSCLQHVYLATSDLRESGGFLRADENLTDRDIEFSSDTKSFRCELCN
jgi:hypothetical protein